MMRVRPPLRLSKLSANAVHDVFVPAARLGLSPGDSVDARALRVRLRLAGRRGSRFAQDTRASCSSVAA